jgi:hypothetical protein
MKSESQPSRNQPRYRKLTVGEVIRILQDCPPNARIQCEGGGFLEAGEWTDWANVEIIEEPNRPPIIKTKWT